MGNAQIGIDVIVGGILVLRHSLKLKMFGIVTGVESHQHIPDFKYQIHSLTNDFLLKH